MMCASCMAVPPRHDGVWAAVWYEDVSRAVVLKLKHGRKPGMARTIGRYLARFDTAMEDAILAPVPLHRWRIWSRGYNQSLLIARSIPGDRYIVPDLLIRTRATPMLRGLGRQERAKAVRGAFVVNTAHREKIKGRTICLVDDVHTSGATIEACATALKRAGAARVTALCWARVPDDTTSSY